jgi:ABC-type branched-subunit amino acid transport system substrate-binding protein
VNLRKWTRTGTALPLVLILGLGSYGGSRGAHAAAPRAMSFTMTIGDVEAYTGDLGSLGAPADKAVKLAGKQLNLAAKHAGLNVHFKVVTTDTQSNPQTAITAARQVVDEGATCLTGPLSTPESIAILNSVTKFKHIAMLPTATSIALRQTNDGHTIFRTVPPDSLQARALVIAVKNFLHGAAGKTVSIGYQNSPYGEGLANAFKASWTALGGKVNGPVGYDPNQATYDSEAQKLVGAKPSAFVIADFPDTFGKVAAALLRTGKFSARKLFVSDALAVSPIPSAIPAAALNGAHATSAGSPTGTPQARAFNTLYLKAPGPRRSALDTNNFDAGILCGLAAVAAQSNDAAKVVTEMTKISGPSGKKFTYLKLAAAMKTLAAGTRIHYMGVSGPIDFNAQGDTSSGFFDISTWKNGTLKVVRQINAKG